MKNINEFKKGDFVTRVEPAKSIGMMDVFGNISSGDRSYIGDKLIFVGIANGCAYFQRGNEFEKMMFGDKLLDLPLDIFSDGWDYWIDPKTLLNNDNNTNNMEVKTNSIMSNKQIEAQIKKAIKEENYELAEQLKKKLLNDK